MEEEEEDKDVSRVPARKRAPVLTLLLLMGVVKEGG